MTARQVIVLAGAMTLLVGCGGSDDNAASGTDLSGRLEKRLPGEMNRNKTVKASGETIRNVDCVSTAKWHQECVAHTDKGSDVSISVDIDPETTDFLWKVTG